MSRPNDLTPRLNFLGITQRDLDLAKKYGPEFNQSMNGALEKAYEVILSTPETAGFFKDKAHADRAQKMQGKHWGALMAGEVNEDYHASALRIGKRHAQIGLEPRWYMGTYALIFGQMLVEKIPAMGAKGLFGKKKRKEAAEAISVFFKLAMLDMDIAVSTYFDALNLERQKKVEEDKETAQHLAEAITELSATITELTASINQTSVSAQETRTATSAMTGNAETSGKAVEQAMEAMSRIAERISAVQEIARQTDLLALNAAVEAARAGSSGAGFAVVATEVRKLAERSQSVSLEIDKVTTESLRAAQEASGDLRSLLPEIRRSSNRVAEIATITTQQSTAVEEINRAILQLSTIAQSLAEGGHTHEDQTVRRFRRAS